MRSVHVAVGVALVPLLAGPMAGEETRIRSGVIEIALFESSASAGQVRDLIEGALLGRVGRVSALAHPSSWSVRLSASLPTRELLDELALLEIGFPAEVEAAELPGRRGAVRRSVLLAGADGYSDADVEAAVAPFGTVVAGQYAGFERIWLLDTNAETGAGVEELVAELELVPQVGWAQTRPVAVLPGEWPNDFFWLDGEAVRLLDLAPDSITIMDSPLAADELDDALGALGWGPFPRILDFGSFFFVCTPSHPRRSGKGLRRLFGQIVAGEIGIPSPTFIDGSSRTIFGPAVVARFEDGVALPRRLELAEAIGTLEEVDALEHYQIRTFARTGLDLLEGANALARLPETRWAVPDVGTVLSWPAGIPPAVAPCEPSAPP